MVPGDVIPGTASNPLSSLSGYFSGKSLAPVGAALGSGGNVHTASSAGSSTSCISAEATAGPERALRPVRY